MSHCCSVQIEGLADKQRKGDIAPHENAHFGVLR
jgi:hypothetical protein